MAVNGRHRETLVYYRRGFRDMHESSCLLCLDELLALEAESHAALASLAAFPGRVLAALEESVGFQGVHV